MRAFTMEPRCTKVIIFRTAARSPEAQKAEGPVNAVPLMSYSGEEWRTFTALVHAHDFPETRARWHGLGREAGFDAVREIFISPTDLFRMYLFRP